MHSCFNLLQTIWRKQKIVNLALRRYSTNNGTRKICIVGSGPAGFYTAQHVLKNESTVVDIYDKLPIPFGLIRYGVAPDHPEIKNAINSFTKMVLGGKCNFFGNVAVGQDVRVSELCDVYDAVILAYGAGEDRTLGIPGENLSNVLSARKFVGWYNGLPENIDEQINLDTDTATVIGHGNVALDVARIILKDINELKVTDIAEHAFEALKKSKIKRVVLVGRRGPLQVAFTIKEFREMIKLTGCGVITSPSDFDGISSLIADLPRPRKRLTELMLSTQNLEQNDGISKWWELKFCRSPKEIVPDSEGRVGKLVLGVNKLKGSLEDAKAVGTGEEDVIDCGLVLRSVGYQSTSIDSFVPFDTKKHIILNERGKVEGKNGLYCSGWVKTGPSGVLLSTMYSSFETGEMILSDIEKGELPFKNSLGSKVILDHLREKGIKVTTFEDWLKIDKVEQEQGKLLGKSRQKICQVEEMLRVAGLS